MFNTIFKLLFYRNISPLHMGCGQDVGIVDNPIVRERHTGYPFIPGSGIRGVFRSCWENSYISIKNEEDRKDKNKVFKSLFGPEMETVTQEKYAGCLSILDAKILLFPVRSDKSVFHWITCPFVLRRYARDVSAFVGDGYGLNIPKNIQVEEDRFVCSSKDTESLTLEEFPFKRQTEIPSSQKAGAEDSKGSEGIGALSREIVDWGRKLGIEEPERILIVSDDAFDYFVRNATIIMQHNRLTTSKTVADGALFSVESVPPESVFYGFVGGAKARSGIKEIPDGEKALDHLFELWNEKDGGKKGGEAYLQLGGDESTGLGITQMRWM